MEDTVEERVKDFMEKNPNCSYVNKEVFWYCYEKIQPYLDNVLLFPIMMSHELARNADDAEKLTSSHLQPHDRRVALIRLAEMGGEYGFMLLYMCICATSDESHGHTTAARVLSDAAKQKCILPPYIRNAENKAESDSIDSSHRHILSTKSSDSSINSGKVGRTRKDSEESGISPATGMSGLPHSVSVSSEPVFDEDYPPANELSFEMIRVNHEFTRLNDTFYAISQSLFRHLEDAHVHPRDVRTHLTVLNSKMLMKEASAIVDKAARELETKGTLTGLFNFLNSCVWNFMDYHLMEYVIKEFGNEELRRRMAQYIRDLQVFESHTTVSQLIEVWSEQDLAPEDCEDATVKIDKDPTRVTVSELNMFRKKLRVEFWPRLSEYASHVLHHCKLRTGCFVVTWKFPSSLRLELEEKACKAHDFFERNKVLSFSIGNKEVYVNKSKFTPEASPFPLLKFPSDSAYGSKRTLSSELESLMTSLCPSKDGSSSGSAASSHASLTPPHGQDSEAEGVSPPPLNTGELMKQLTAIERKKMETLYWDNGKRLVRDKRARTDKGCYPSIAINDRDSVVEVNHQPGTNLMFYRVGVWEEKGAIQWESLADATLGRPPKKRYYSSGAYPRVAINDENTILEVHKGQCSDMCFYRIGRADMDKRKISWGNSTYFNVGLNPDVGVNNKNTALVVFMDNIFTKHLNYRVGQISRVGGEVTWSTGKKRVGVKAEAYSIDINDSGTAVLSYQTPLHNHIHYQVGMVSAKGGMVEWILNVHRSTGFTPAVSITNDNQVIQIHQSLTKRHLVSNVGVACWNDAFKGVCWSSEEDGLNRHYGKGLYPSVAANSYGHVVEVHEPRLAANRNRLHYYMGEMQTKNN